jgi:hypothetical protein
MPLTRTQPEQGGAAFRLGVGPDVCRLARAAEELAGVLAGTPRSADGPFARSVALEAAP